MSSGKRKGDSEDLPPGKKVRGVKAATCDKWISDNDAELTTSAWLIYDRQKNDRLLAECLKCSVCIKFVDRVRSCKNFSEAFITGFKNLRTSAFKDHAGTEMHKRGMNHFRRQECPARRSWCRLSGRVVRGQPRQVAEELGFSKYATIIRMLVHRRLVSGHGQRAATSLSQWFPLGAGSWCVYTARYF